MKCGLEIHQRLDTKKLFCECYADPNKAVSEKEYMVTRRLIALSGETGTTDQAALFEAASEKTFEYTCGEKTSCLVDIDEEPPHLMNENALTIALQLAKVLKAKIANELHVMRKTIIDGSAVSGFQRTVLIGMDGEVKVGGKKIGIETVCLEEESARIIDRTNGKRVSYGLDRQGIPLIEIATAPDIDSPQMAKKVALEIGEILRNTGLVQRGIGTIRQDLNVSIEGGERIEIKGCQDLDAIEKIIENEANRQKALLEIREELEHRKAKPNGKIVDITPVFKNTESKIISNGIAGGVKVFAVKLSGFKNLLCKEIMPGFSFGKELEDRARQMGAKEIMHSDEELEKTGISLQERKTIEELLNLTGEDAFILCLDGEATARKSLQAAVQRANQAIIGIQKETRRADGLLTRFMRPLGGAARMYPETDSPLKNIIPRQIEELSGIEAPSEKKKRYKEIGLNEELAKRMAAHPKFQLFEKSITTTKCDAGTAAVTLLETLTALRREGVKVDDVSDEALLDILAKYGEGTIAKTAIPQVIRKAAEHREKSIAKIIFENNLQKIENDALRKIALEHGGNIAEIMKKYRANIDAVQLKELILHLQQIGKLPAEVK